MRRAIIALALATLPTVAAAQAVAPAADTAAVDPARLTVARRVIDTIMPPATREQMMSAMLTPMMANIRQGMNQNPDFAKMMGDDPKVAAAFERYMQRQQARSIEMIGASLPQMATAMSRAYARRFDVAQLEEIERFFKTPTGRAYMQASMTIMADPDVAAWQRTMMNDAMSHVQQDTAQFVKEITAIKQGEKK
ncbi:DUF2059 domain-containing protein [Sphingomonas sp. Tas61C01]|uniref:DUF2059 domain-containing protein n=1 Tax=Sphingomonas sp. Tas61C01 TaxID=3458297 RepID=UPI00403EE90A